MGSYWYPNIVAELATRGVNVTGYPGFETRSRSSGGFEQVRGIIVHHTASNTNPASDLAYMVNADDGPISNGLLDRSGLYTVIAAGASNHGGKGGGTPDGGGVAWHTSHGLIPGDDSNRWAWGIEAANAGVTGSGDPWPVVQQDAYVTLVAALCDIFELDPARDVWSHAFLADGTGWTTRKVDPRGEARWQPANGSQPWVMTGFRAEVAAALTNEEEEPVTESEMDRIAAKVWAAQLHNYVAGTPMDAQALLGYAHAEAYDGAWARTAENFVNHEQQALSDLVRFAHYEAATANEKCDRILAALEALGLPGGGGT